MWLNCKGNSCFFSVQTLPSVLCKMLNPINFITPPLLFLDVFKFCLEERLASLPLFWWISSSLLIFPAPYGATDTSPAGCSRPRGSQQTSSGSGCHLHRPARLSVRNRAREQRQRFPSSRSPELAPSAWQNTPNGQMKHTFRWLKPAHIPHHLEKLSWKTAKTSCQGVRASVQQTWSLPMAELWKRGFHLGLSLIREASLISCHPMLWFICILCHKVMESCLTVCSENPKDVV